MPSHPFCRDVYDQIHQTPQQEKFRRIHPMPLGVVFVEWPGMTEDDWRHHLRMMKDVGVTALKGILLCRGSDKRKFMHMALDEGIIPWWYGQGGWEAITDELLDSLGIDRDTPIAEIREDQRMLDYQQKVLRDRIDAQHDSAPLFAHRIDRKVFSFDYELHPDAVGQFVLWLQQQYDSVEKLSDAWNLHHAGIHGGGRSSAWESWQDVAAALPEAIGPREYRRIRDVMRFKADWYNEQIRRRVRDNLAADPHEPLRAGGEMGLFLPFAARSTDMEGIAELMAEGGSFYPSIHLAWHFEEVYYEAPKSVYLQASLVVDWFKGGWCAPWESTGGPQQLSGGKGMFEGAEDYTPGFTVDEGVMTQLMLTYLAAGMRGFGLWCWSARTAGWEAGEFALLDRNNEICQRTRQVGRIGQAAQKYRDELWQARKEPMVGIFTDFDNEAMWAAVSVNGRDKYRHFGVQARIGASRAMVNHNIPFEYVTGSDLRNGLSGRYKTIYLPAVLAVDSQIAEILHQYVADGGRLVVDMPSTWLDEFGRLLPTGQGSWFEQTFGAKLRDFQFSRNVTWRLGGRALEGFVIELEPTEAEVVASFDSGKPARTVHKLGRGEAVIAAHELSLACWREGNEWGEQQIAELALGDARPAFVCREVQVYRLAGAEADHYYLINSGPAVEAQLDTGEMKYAACVDAITGRELSIGDPIDVPAHSGRWLRMAKQG
ncbi:MAG: beta-galactosidase trimerization domain-containing protein [Phycisphaerae bacterium]